MSSLTCPVHPLVRPPILPRTSNGHFARKSQNHVGSTYVWKNNFFCIFQLYSSPFARLRFRLSNRPISSCPSPLDVCVQSPALPSLTPKTFLSDPSHADTGTEECEGVVGSQIRSCTGRRRSRSTCCVVDVEALWEWEHEGMGNDETGEFRHLQQRGENTHQMVDLDAPVPLVLLTTCPVKRLASPPLPLPHRPPCVDTRRWPAPPRSFYTVGTCGHVRGGGSSVPREGSDDVQ